MEYDKETQWKISLKAKSNKSAISQLKMLIYAFEIAEMINEPMNAFISKGENNFINCVKNK